MKIYLASDHAGYELKNQLANFLASAGYEVNDLGPATFDPDDDYPDFALKVAKKVAETGAKGILICATGQGTAMAANKVKGIRAYLAWDELTARHAMTHGNANILTLGAKTLDSHKAFEIVKIFLGTEFSGEPRHQRRLAKVAQIEESNLA